MEERQRIGSRSLFDPNPRGENSEEHARLAAANAGAENWRRWGPYLSERQWGTCREDYSSHGNSWAYLGHDNAHRVAYRWGEDGIGGISDIEQQLCASIAMWNGNDHVLKERLFGLSNPEGNHGEDVKEYYYYLDATPSHSYLKMLYKYPQAAFPYERLREEQGDLSMPEYELLDTGIFDEDRYFDIYVEYARPEVDDILAKVTAHNRGPDAAELHLVPQVFFRNTWSWTDSPERPSMTHVNEGHVRLDHKSLGSFHLFHDKHSEVLFCENETNCDALAAAAAAAAAQAAATMAASVAFPEESSGDTAAHVDAPADEGEIAGAGSAPGADEGGPPDPGGSRGDGGKAATGVEGGFARAQEGACEATSLCPPAEGAGKPDAVLAAAAVDASINAAAKKDTGATLLEGSVGGSAARIDAPVDEGVVADAPKAAFFGEGGVAHAEEGAPSESSPGSTVDGVRTAEILYHATARVGPGPYKDAFHACIINNDQAAKNTSGGTKVGLHSRHVVPAGGSVTVRFRLTALAGLWRDPWNMFEQHFQMCVSEADEFYEVLQKEIVDQERRRIHRQALAGMIWSKQFYFLDLHTFFDGDAGCAKPPLGRRKIRNAEWDHMYNCDIISMPDKWEFPWYATWDLAFHCIPLALVDPWFAKSQLKLLVRDSYMHANGQLPAFEWNFSDCNPPVHAWATWRVFQIDRKECGGEGDLVFLEEVYHKLVINFTWWVNRKDAEGRNIFHGGFLGLDNIGIFERSGELPTGGHINQSDGTSWMAFYSLNLMRIAMELALHNPTYEQMAMKFFEHFLRIAQAMTQSSPGLWDEVDEFYYDFLILPDSSRNPLKVRSMVGLIPLFAVEVLEPSLLDRLPRFAERVRWIFDHRPELAATVSQWPVPGTGKRRLLSLLPDERVKSLLRRMLDPAEFLSDHGVRALSRYHLAQPYVFKSGARTYEIHYEPGDSAVEIMGGNSNWRGPVWFPMNYLIIESLQKFYQYYGEDLQIEYPTGSGRKLSILGISDALSERLIGLFELGVGGTRPAMMQHPKLATDPHFRDNVLFYEHFNGDTGCGIGASHQTGWTGLVAKLIQMRTVGVGFPRKLS